MNHFFGRACEVLIILLITVCIMTLAVALLGRNGILNTEPVKIVHSHYSAGRNPSPVVVPPDTSQE